GRTRLGRPRDGSAAIAGGSLSASLQVELVAAVFGNQLADLIDNLVAMRLAKQVGGVDVALFDAADHVLMFGDITLRQAVGKSLVIETQQPAPFIKKPRKECGVERVAARFGNGCMKVARSEEHTSELQ